VNVVAANTSYVSVDDNKVALRSWNSAMRQQGGAAELGQTAARRHRARPRRPTTCIGAVHVPCGGYHIWRSLLFYRRRSRWGHGSRRQRPGETARHALRTLTVSGKS
jgi:hypothetical protein